MVLVASCGDSEKEPSPLDVAVSDAKAYAKFQCEIIIEMIESQGDGKAKKLMEELNEEKEKMEKKYYYDSDIPEYVKNAYRDQLKAEQRKCEKITGDKTESRADF